MRAGAAGRTPLHIAVAIPLWTCRIDGGVAAIVDLLIESSPGALTVPDANNDLTLHVAIARSSDEANRPSAEDAWSVQLVTTLLDRCPGSIRTKGAGGKLPLHVAVCKDPPSLPVVQLLVQRCPESLEVKDEEGKLPLHVAVSKDGMSLPLVQLLVEGRPELLGKADSEGNVAFVLAAEKARFRAKDTTTQTASLDVIYWLVRTNPASVASHPTRAEARSSLPLESSTGSRVVSSHAPRDSTSCKTTTCCSAAPQ
jgi:ankyrin repeat protein